MEKLTKDFAAEAEAANAVWQLAQAASATPEETSVSDESSQVPDIGSEGSDSESAVRLHTRAVCTLLFRLVLVYFGRRRNHFSNTAGCSCKRNCWEPGGNGEAIVIGSI